MENENEKIGIDSLLTVVDFVCDLANDGVASFADGKITFADAPRFMDNVFAIPKVVRVAGNVDEEFLDIDPEETAILEARVAEKLKFADGAPKEVSKAVVTVIFRSSSFVKSIIDLVKLLKSLKGA